MTEKAPLLPADGRLRGGKRSTAQDQYLKKRGKLVDNMSDHKLQQTFGRNHVCALWTLRIFNLAITVLGLCIVGFAVAALVDGASIASWFMVTAIPGGAVAAMGVLGFISTFRRTLMAIYFDLLFFLTVLLIWLAAYALLNPEVIEEALLVKFQKHWGDMYDDFPGSWKTKMARSARLVWVATVRLEFSAPLSRKRVEFSIQAPEKWCRISKRIVE